MSVYAQARSFVELNLDAALSRATAVFEPAPLSRYINLDGEMLQLTLIVTMLAPLIWNVLARTIRTLLPEPKVNARPELYRYALCYLLAVWIFAFSAFRDYLFVTSARANASSHHLISFTHYCFY